MLIKEYRIPLPLTVDEYKIAQLYMIAKKSREESKGAGSGVEILVNEPYTDGPGPQGTGQYTHKIYHIGSHLPGWLKSLMPKSALIVEEEAWNAYPYTKTKYKCPFVERFTLEIETYYFNDDGSQDNVFGLSKSELRERSVDVIDIVKDQSAEYMAEEDPRCYRSEKTSRGPLKDTWIEDYWRECRGCDTPLSNGKAIMCAYKLCKVEFKYWGMQTKIERFIDDVALRKTMVRAHKQAWVWQDEWWGLSIEDIRQIERETQEALAAKMAFANEMEGGGSTNSVNKSSRSASVTPTSKDAPDAIPDDGPASAPVVSASAEDPQLQQAAGKHRVSFGDSRQKLFPRAPDRRPSRGSTEFLSSVTRSP